MDDFKLLDVSAYQKLGNPLLAGYGQPTPRRYDLHAFDPASTLILSEPILPPSRPTKTNIMGVPGEIEQMLPIFDACLRVGKVERAAMVLTRIMKSDLVSRDDLIYLHNRYLRASLDQMRSHPNRKQAQELCRWYELSIRGKGLPQTAETVACMLKASLLSEHNPERLHRLVHRYMGMAPGETGLQVLSMADILTDQDLAVITDICPTYNLAPEEVSVADEEVEMEITHEEATAAAFDSMPEVLATPQKGFGLKTLKKTLSLFDEIPQNCDISTLSPEDRREIQARLERDCIDAAVERWREENEALQKMGLNSSMAHASLNSRLYDWHQALENRLKDELKKVEVSEATARKTPADYDRCVYGPFLRQSSPSRLAAVTILSTLSSVAITGVDRGLPLSTAISALAKLAEDDIKSQAQDKKTSAQRAKRGRIVRFANQTSLSPPPQGLEAGTGDPISAEKVVEAAETAATKPAIAWPVTIRAKVGAALLTALLETAKIKVVREHPETGNLVSQLQPAFSHTSKLRKGRPLGIILLNQELVKIMKSEPQGDFLAKHLPMVVEPAPWSKFDKGGFLESTANLVRVKNAERDQRIYTEAALARGDMDQVLKGLDVLGKTSWRINVPVLNVMLEAWNTGEELAEIPPLHPNIPLPPEPDVSEDPVERRRWIRAVKAIEDEKSGLHSVRCFMNFQLEIARAFRNQTFYFPHNIDFRGRAYPLPTYLNHMGADHVRGLLRFGKGKELGESGLRWLKVQLANVYGFDKASLDERVAFTMDNMDKVLDSANNPLGGSRWWLQAEDPWQCLATCFELKAAMALPDPTRFVSHLPVHQDGTCNGLQHYAALGGDSWGARQVNLEPGARPADVYSAVADIVKKHIADDVAAGNPFAMALDGKITRKVVKQTVMTNVYGVTFAGAKKQVCKQLDSLYPNLRAESGFEPIILASYIATQIFKALSSMFRGAHDIQYWLGEIGGRVCRALSAEQLDQLAKDDKSSPSPKSPRKKSSAQKASSDELLSQFRATIVWTTPLRMPVVQPYRKSGTKTIKTSLQHLSMIIPERSDPVNRRKQLQAFPPNFIHSLDATHMLLSALECDDLGLSFAAVHDSFWTHAADVDVMNRVLRDAFVRIHSEDVVRRLAAEFETRYRGSIYLAKINRGTPVEAKISAWRKKARLSSKEELLLEHKRQQLLRSTDPQEVEEGKQMVTAASIVEEMSAASETLAETEDIDEIGLGHIPDGADALSAADDAADSLVDDSQIEDDFEAVQLAADEGQTDENEVASAEGGQDANASGAEWSKSALKMLETRTFEERIKSTPQRKTRAAPAVTNIWLPLSFPEVPAKGDFDVQKLKSSEYFFS